MLNNPLIKRYRCSLLRPSQFWIYITVYLSVLVLLLFINYATYQYQSFYSSLSEFFSGIYFQFIIFEVIILWAWATYNSGSAIKEEISENSYDFFRMLPMPAYKKMIGILVGKNLVTILFSGINFGFLLFFGLSGQVNLSLQGQIFIMLIAVTVLTNSAALLSSIGPVRKKKKHSPLIAILLAFFFIPPLLGALGQLARNEDFHKHRVGFYNLDIPILLLISAITLYFSCWVTKGIIRRFTLEDEPLFDSKGALLFLLGYEIVTLGLFFQHFSKSLIIVYLFWAFTLAPAMVVVLCSLKNMDKYFEYSRELGTRPNKNKHMMPALLAHSNLFVGVGLFAIWASFAIGTILGNDLDLMQNFFILLTLFSFYAFMLLILELYAVYKGTYSKIGLLLVFIFAVYLILPLILSGVMGNEVIYRYSLFGYLGGIITEPNEDFILEPSVLLINLALCIIPAMLVWKRYVHILDLRKKM